jgi:chromosome segregation ATPase
MKFSKRKKLNTDFKMKKVDYELRRIVEKNLGDINFSVGSITGEYGNFVDEYAYANGWSNASGDIEDTQKKIDALRLKITGLNDRYSFLQSEMIRLDIAIKGMPNTTNKQKNARSTVISEQETKRKEMSNIPSLISSANAQIASYIATQEKQRNDLRLAEAIKEAERLAEIKRLATIASGEANRILAEKGISGEAEKAKADGATKALMEATRLKAEADSKVAQLRQKSSGRNKAFIIGGAIILLGVLGYFVFRKK